MVYYLQIFLLTTNFQQHRTFERFYLQQKFQQYLWKELHRSVVYANFFANLLHFLRMFGRTDEFQKTGPFAFKPWYICAWGALTFNAKTPYYISKKLSGKYETVTWKRDAVFYSTLVPNICETLASYRTMVADMTENFFVFCYISV